MSIEGLSISRIFNRFLDDKPAKSLFFGPFSSTRHVVLQSLFRFLTDNMTAALESVVEPTLLLFLLANSHAVPRYWLHTGCSSCCGLTPQVQLGECALCYSVSAHRHDEKKAAIRLFARGCNGRSSTASSGECLMTFLRTTYCTVQREQSLKCRNFLRQSVMEALMNHRTS